MSNIPNFINDINRWKTENVLNLANHFHKFHSNNGQHERVKQYQLIDTVEGFQNIATLQTQITSGNIEEIRMHMALRDEPNQANFKAYMILEVKDNTSAIYHYFMNPTEEAPCNNTDDPESDLVPKIFKDMIAKNWDEMDFHLIDDLFVANVNTQMLRVHYFEIGTKMITHINNNLLGANDIIEAITIYPGVDLNKFSDKSTISYTPVLGFRMKDPLNKRMGLFGATSCGQNEIFIEYSLPCPPCSNS